MKYNIILKCLICACASFASFSVLAEMTDNQVLEYITQAVQQGKTQQQIGKELAVRGVTPAQLQRVKKIYESTGASNASNSATPKKTTSTRRQQSSNNQTGRNSSMSSFSPMTDESEETTGKVYINEYGDSILLISQGNDDVLNPVYGRDIFTNQKLTFEPNVNMATPENYRLGPGDEVVINIWGNNEANIRDYISPEGTIIVSNIGPVYLNGMTVKEANNHLKNVFAQKYADIADEGSDISLVLGDLRTIQVDIMGEVKAPGSYRLSPFSTLFNALYNAGGTTPTGTLRNIDVFRNGKKVASADIYDYLFKGKTSADIKLQEGDVIIVSPYDRLVTLESGVKRPMTYELKKGETIIDALNYAGGLSSDAFGERINIIRTTGEGLTVLTVEEGSFDKTPLIDGDIIEIGNSINRFNNRIEIQGAVFRPGVYALDNQVRTVKDLITKADGLTEDAYLGRAQLFRLADDLSQTVEAIDLASIMSGRSSDILLNPNDVLVVSSVLDLMPKGDFTITGAVSSPGKYTFAEGTTVEDLIMRAGGLQEGASEAKVDISRRITDKNATGIQSKIAETYTISLKDGLVVDGERGFVLQPNDIVDVRFSPTFVTQRRVQIEGEVPFPGSYTLSNRTERLSDLVKRAGGVSQYAYLKGAHITRRFTEDEKAAREELLRLAANGTSSDTISQQMIITSDYYPVGINLEAALANPGGYEDLVLQEGDQLFIPELVNTVKISGDVLYPNSVIYTPGKKLSYYIDQAGGYGDNANKGHSYVIYMNGQVSRGKNSPIEPGCQIVVPTKEKKDTAANFQKWLAIGSSAASLGTMAASIVNLIKR